MKYLLAMSMLSTTLTLSTVSAAADSKILMSEDTAIYAMDGVNSIIIAAVVQRMLETVAPKGQYQRVKVNYAGKSLIDTPTLSVYTVDLEVGGRLETCEMPSLKESLAVDELWSNPAAFSIEKWTAAVAKDETLHARRSEEIRACSVDLSSDGACSVHVSVNRYFGNDYNRNFNAQLTGESCPIIKRFGITSLNASFRKISPLEISVETQSQP